MLNCAVHKIIIVDVPSQWETWGEWLCNETSQRQHFKMSFLFTRWSLACSSSERLRELGGEAPASNALCHKTFSKIIWWKLSAVKRLKDLWISLTLHSPVSLEGDYGLWLFFWCLVKGAANISAAEGLQWQMWNLGTVLTLTESRH